jgi:hypothetical protein
MSSNGGFQWRRLALVALIFLPPIFLSGWIFFAGTPAEKDLATTLSKQLFEPLAGDCRGQFSKNLCEFIRVRGHLPSAIVDAYQREQLGQAVFSILKLKAWAIFSSTLICVFVALWMREKNRTRRLHIAGARLRAAEEIARKTSE